MGRRLFPHPLVPLDSANRRFGDSEDQQLTGTFNAVTPLADSMNRLRFQLPLFAFIRTVFNAAHRMVYPFLGVFARRLGVDGKAMSLALTARAAIGTFGPFA